VAIVNRSEDRARQAVELLGGRGRVVTAEAASDAVGGAHLVVNATPVGMGRPTPGDVPVDPELLHDGQVVVDLIYTPRETPLLAAARDRGAVAVNGVPMLVHQAAVAFTLWTGVPAPLAAMSAAVEGEV
jgi:shikimate dehydrogenase